MAQAGPYCGWGGGWGGYYRGGCGPGWYGTGIPNGVGWSMFGLAAAGGLAAGAAYAAPVVYAPPVYSVPAPVYTIPAPVYTAPAYSSIGYYQPPRSVVVEEKKASREIPSNTLAKAEAKLAGLGYYKGSVDGEYGPVIQQAIQQFQADNGLPVSGRLDLKTLSSLGIAL